MRKTATKNCENCGLEYQRNRSFSAAQWASSRYCSRQCRGKAIAGISTGPKPEIRIGEEIPCAECGAKFYAAPWAIIRRPGNNKFCSKECTYKGRELKATFVKGHGSLMSPEAHKRAGKSRSITMTGRKLSPAHCASISASKIGKKLSAEHIRNSLRRRGMSSLEEKFNAIVVDAGLPYRFVGNGDVMVGRKNPDFVASDGSKVAIEVFYRRHKDRFRGGVDVWRAERKAVFNGHGWEIIFFDETQVQAEHVKVALGGVLSQTDFG